MRMRFERGGGARTRSLQLGSSLVHRTAKLGDGRVAGLQSCSQRRELRVHSRGRSTRGARSVSCALVPLGALPLTSWSLRSSSASRSRSSWRLYVKSCLSRSNWCWVCTSCCARSVSRLPLVDFDGGTSILDQSFKKL
eukprot:scaffold4423_cov105-Isochrysis_galbana.AAC.10